MRTQQIVPFWIFYGSRGGLLIIIHFYTLLWWLNTLCHFGSFMVTGYHTLLWWLIKLGHFGTFMVEGDGRGEGGGRGLLIIIHFYDDNDSTILDIFLGYPVWTISIDAIVSKNILLFGILFLAKMNFWQKCFIQNLSWSKSFTLHMVTQSQYHLTCKRSTNLGLLHWDTEDDTSIPLPGVQQSKRL